MTHKDLKNIEDDSTLFKCLWIVKNKCLMEYPNNSSTILIEPAKKWIAWCTDTIYLNEFEFIEAKET